MATPSTTRFSRSALASGLVTADQLDEAREALRAAREAAGRRTPPSDEAIADALVEMDVLNRWQSKQLLEGRTRFHLGPYQMIDWIGRGGMGQVFKARHGVLDRVVAVKVLPRSKSTPEAVANFMREIRVLAKLDHPNLVRALDAGEDGNVCYLVTEYVPGTDLRKLIRRGGPLSIERACEVISQTAAGLHHAHQEGLVHRDVKPGNVLVTPEGGAKLSDLGLAGPLSGDTEVDPRHGKIVGTSDYLAPDHIQAPWNPTPAWDIYALGCTLYYAATGKVPFPGGSTADKARAHCELRPIDPRRLNSKLTDGFVEVLADMMAKDPAERLPSALAVIARLTSWVRTPPARSCPNGFQPASGARSETVAWSDWGPGEAAQAVPADGNESSLDDTEASFPEIVGVLDDPTDSGESSQTTYPLAASDQVTSAPGKLEERRPEEALSIFYPLIVLVVFPLGVVGLVILLAWLGKLFG